MSRAEPVGESRPSRAALAIRRAKAQPTMANVVDAISEMHDEFSSDIAELKADVEQLKADVAQLKAAMAALQSDVGKLLHHFGLTSGGTP